MSGMLAGKRLLITGVVTTDSIARAVAHRSLEMGAQVVLTSFDRDMERTRAAASELDSEVPEHREGIRHLHLLLDMARAITGEIVHVDAGYHAMAATLR